MHVVCPFVAGVQVSLQGQRVVIREVAIDPKTSMQQMPAISSAASADRRERVVSQIVREDPICGAFFDRSTVLRGSKALSDCAATTCDCGAPGILRFLRNDVYDPVHGIVAPDRATRPSNYFDSVNVFQGH